VNRRNLPGTLRYNPLLKNRGTAKEQITQIVQQQPDDSSYDEIIRELAFHLMIERGLKDSDEGRTISNEEMEARINTWLK
jgi:predicted transcriptional regulator